MTIIIVVQQCYSFCSLIGSLFCKKANRERAHLKKKNKTGGPAASESTPAEELAIYQNYNQSVLEGIASRTV